MLPAADVVRPYESKHNIMAKQLAALTGLISTLLAGLAIRNCGPSLEGESCGPVAHWSAAFAAPVHKGCWKRPLAITIPLPAPNGSSC